MIKLIASDMDGTLLNDRKELPGDFFEVFDELERRGIKFTVASGRSFDAVAHLFPEEYAPAWTSSATTAQTLSTRESR